MPLPFTTRNRLRGGANHHLHEMGQPRYVALCYDRDWWGIFDRAVGHWAGIYGTESLMVSAASGMNRSTRTVKR